MAKNSSGNKGSNTSRPTVNPNSGKNINEGFGQSPKPTTKAVPAFSLPKPPPKK